MINFLLRLIGIKVETLTIEEAKRRLGDSWKD